VAAVRLICGVDEAGRGPLAGPVYAAAVIFEPGRRAPAGIADSKVLSARERDVLELIADGQSNKEIARALGLSPETIKSHVKNIFGKLSVTNRAQAAVRARNLGLGRVPSS